MLEILQHEIYFWLEDKNGKLIDDPPLNECDEEHIEEMIKQGFSEGELCQYDHLTNTEYRGWWKIVKH